MKKPRILIADCDSDYLIPLQMAFLRETRERIHLEVVSDAAYFAGLFSAPQELDSLLASERFLSAAGLDPRALNANHRIGRIYLLTEERGAAKAYAGTDVTPVYMYDSFGDMLKQVLTQNLSKLMDVGGSRLALVCSAHGGAGKTTVALGMCECLSRNGKKALYIGASRLQTFQYLLREEAAISNELLQNVYSRPADVYRLLRRYQCIRTKGGFDYVLPFRRSIQSVSLNDSVYRLIAEAAKQSGDYDVVVLDAENPFERRALDIADKIVVTLNQSRMSLLSTVRLADELMMDPAQLSFLCAAFPKADGAQPPEKEQRGFSIDEYIRFFEDYDKLNCADFAKDAGIQYVSQVVLMDE